MNSVVSLSHPDTSISSKDYLKKQVKILIILLPNGILLALP